MCAVRDAAGSQWLEQARSGPAYVCICVCVIQMMNTIEYRVDCQLLRYLHSENNLGFR